MKVKGVKYNRLRAQIVFPVPPQTTVREFGPDAVALMDEPKESDLRKYHEYMDKRHKRRG